MSDSAKGIRCGMPGTGVFRKLVSMLRVPACSVAKRLCIGFLTTVLGWLEVALCRSQENQLHGRIPAYSSEGLSPGDLGPERRESGNKP
jgi:hypothetical protein